MLTPPAQAQRFRNATKFQGRERLEIIALVLQFVLVDGQPDERRGPSVAGDEMQRERGLIVGVDKDELKNQRNDFEDLCLSRLKALLPEGVAVTILADRAPGSSPGVFEFLESLGFQYVIRFRGAIQVSAADGETPGRRLGRQSRAGA